jgi:hypothetical protein
MEGKSDAAAVGLAVDTLSYSNLDELQVRLTGLAKAAG